MVGWVQGKGPLVSLYITPGPGLKFAPPVTRIPTRMAGDCLHGELLVIWWLGFRRKVWVVASIPVGIERSHPTFSCDICFYLLLRLSTLAGTRG